MHYWSHGRGRGERVGLTTPPPLQVNGKLTPLGQRGGLPLPNGGMERKPVRIRRGPATVTGERSPTQSHGRIVRREGRGGRRSGSQETLAAGHVEPGRGP
ncbi:hypothetical protein GCM10009801_40470 [Streptomyces albiaxialis]|uniref:Uncharacterized protein n=1 Tax=Streptomyces albiaxialis TaxID=329523 RepID=A0ABN2W309_9ACTN